MTRTLDYEELSYITNKESNIQEVSDAYFHYVINVNILLDEIEATDNEMMTLSEKTGQFLFLENKDEDIYTESDGSPL